jgi:hypothetical protein
MNQLFIFKNFFHLSLATQNEILVKNFGIAAHSDNFTQEAFQTTVPAPYLSFIYGLIARTLYISYATVCLAYPKEVWEEESIDMDIFSSNCDTGPILDSNDDNLESFSITT